MHDARGGSRSNAHRAFLGGAIWAAIVLPAVVIFFSIVGFEPARVCVHGHDKPLEGYLVANTRDQVLLLQRKGIRATLTVPGDQVDQLYYGGDEKNVRSCSQMFGR
jgi:hypothetical protein